MDIGRAVPSSGLQGEERIDQMRAGEGHEIRASGRDDRVDLIGGRDRADAHGGDAGIIADLVAANRVLLEEVRMRLLRAEVADARRPKPD